jgi:Mitochondrial inner membrane protein
MNVNAVHLAYSQAHDKLHEAAKYNTQVLSVTQLCDALDKSGAVAQQVNGVLAVAPDEVVKAAVMSVPEAAATEGVSTVDQLQRKWPVIRRTLRVDSALSKEPKQGFLSTCLAVVSSALKVYSYNSLCVHTRLLD